MIGHLKLVQTTRKLLEVIMYIAKKSFRFYSILMIYVLASSFSHLAMKDVDFKFRDSFEISYRNTFTDFGAEDERTEPRELIAFLVYAYFGPMILLTLLITVMADSYANYFAKWEIHEIKGIYHWA